MGLWKRNFFGYRGYKTDRKEELLLFMAMNRRGGRRGRSRGRVNNNQE